MFLRQMYAKVYNIKRCSSSEPGSLAVKAAVATIGKGQIWDQLC